MDIIRIIVVDDIDSMRYLMFLYSFDRELMDNQDTGMKAELASLDSGAKADGILEVMPDGFTDRWLTCSISLSST